MKKNLVTVMLVIALVSAGAFAANPANVSFEVQTTVSGINLMKLTTSDIADLNVLPTSLDEMTEFEDPVEIDETGATEDFTAFITVLSNNQAGFVLSMSATAMTSQTAGNTHSIHYTALVNGVSYATKTDSTAIPVISQGPITALTGVSKEIAISVDMPSFNAALEDDYSGTVTFNYVAN